MPRHRIGTARVLGLSLYCEHRPNNRGAAPLQRPGEHDAVRVCLAIGESEKVWRAMDQRERAAYEEV